MRILWFPHSDNPAYAGVRLRSLLPAFALRKAGHDVRVGTGQQGQLADAAVVQGKWLLDCATPLAMQPRLDLLRKLRGQGCRLTLDCFDNYFLNHDGNPDRAALLAAFRSSLDLFASFTVSSPGLVPFFQAEIGPSTYIRVIGDPLEGPGAHRLYETAWQRANPGRWASSLAAVRRNMAIRWRRRSACQLIWFGNQGSRYAKGGMGELARIVEPLTRASRQMALKLTVVSNSRARYEEVIGRAGFAHEYVDWDRIHFAGLLQQHDLVVLPSALTPFTSAKSNNRLLLPLSMGIPVMADALPDYLPWQKYFQLGGWDNLASHLGSLGQLRARAHAAHEVISANYSLEAIGSEWVKVLERSVTQPCQ